MKVLKKELSNTLIYLPVENRNVIGKFIDVRLYPYLSKKYPDLFEDEKIEDKKTTKKDVISINNTEQSPDNNNSSE